MEDFLNEIKKKLESKKQEIESELETFAEKNKDIKDDWKTKHPKLNEGIGSEAIEGEADEVEEYAELLPVEHSLELKLRDINFALEKIEKGTYGKCEKCGKEISKERLLAIPEAKFCLDCEKEEEKK